MVRVCRIRRTCIIGRIVLIRVVWIYGMGKKAIRYA
jgi:hypothetical protein